MQLIPVLAKFIFTLSLVASLVACQANSGAQSRPGEMEFEPDADFPFGRANPNAPPQLQQFAFMIGRNDCREERLSNATGEWVEGYRTWDAYYFMNGNAIRDSGRSGAATNGNIRVYDAASGQWHVTYISTPVYGTGTWSGSMVEGRIELEQPQKAPGTDIDGVNRLTFYDIQGSSFRWKGEWASLDNSIVREFWRMECEKVS